MARGPLSPPPPPPPPPARVSTLQRSQPCLVPSPATSASLRPTNHRPKAGAQLPASATSYAIYIGAEYCAESRAFEAMRREATSEATEPRADTDGIARLAVRIPTMAGGEPGCGDDEATAATAASGLPAPWLDVLGGGLGDEEEATELLRMQPDSNLPKLIVIDARAEDGGGGGGDACGGGMDPSIEAALSGEIEAIAAVSLRSQQLPQDGASSAAAPPPPPPASAAAGPPDLATAAGCVAAALEAYNTGDLASAAAHFSDALKLDPNNRDASYNLGSLLLALGKPLLAVPHFRHVVLVDPTDRTASHVLGGVLGDMEPAAVANAYREVVRQQPDNVRAKHMLATLTGEGEASQSAAAEYVREIFDELSEEFEDKLVNHLEYQVPWQLLEAVDAAAQAEQSNSATEADGEGDLKDKLEVKKWPDGSWRALDLGCGSGLCGR
mmetsp:Transcript_43734/g.119553  ORF Transcript_43734/g.119553 Transcript_43734/m.119553 type:complete len:441 (+) Transcript_43734:171-1493(+)